MAIKVSQNTREMIKSFETRRLRTCSWRRKGDNSHAREKRRKTNLSVQADPQGHRFHIIKSLWGMARYQGQNKKGTPFVMNLKSFVPCHLILQTYVSFQRELWIKVTFGHHCTIEISVTLRHYFWNKMFPWHFILLKKKSLLFLNCK